MSSNSSEAIEMRVMHDMCDAVLVLDRRGKVVFFNEPASRMLEYDSIPGDSEKGPLFSLNINQQYNDGFNECVLDALYHKKETHVQTVRYMSPSGRKYVFRMSCSYLQDGDGELVITLADETEAAVFREKFMESSRIFSTFLYSFCVWIILYALWEFLGQPFPSKQLTRGVEVLGVVMFLYIARFTKLSWQDLGLGFDGVGRKLRTGAAIALASVLFLIALKGVIRLFAPNAFEPTRPFLDLAAFGLPQVLYIFTAGIQEFLARSVIQGSLRRIMIGKHVAAAAILLSSLIFAALHIHLGFAFMAGAVILAGLEGILYEKYRSVYPIWVIHWAFGVTGTLLHFIDH